MELLAFIALLIYIGYWIIKAMIDKYTSEAFLGMGVGILSMQIFIIANYSGQFLRINMPVNLNITLQLFGALLIILSIWLLAWAFISKRKMSSLVSFWGSTQLFMTQGVYGVIRHPIQLGGIFASIGITLLMLNIALIALSIISIIAFLFSSNEEDIYGKEMLGEEYKTYMSSVPSFNVIQGISKVINNRSA